jgi:hypothetical protein
MVKFMDESKPSGGEKFAQVVKKYNKWATKAGFTARTESAFKSKWDNVCFFKWLDSIYLLPNSDTFLAAKKYTSANW